MSALKFSKAGGLLLALLLRTASALAVDPLVEPAQAPAPDKAKPQYSKGKRIREKEAEGTQAPNRFEADTVIKSKYELNGQPLEVDPD